jgi:small-conductance mechanosensitive channel
MNFDWMPYLPEVKTILIAMGVALILWVIAHLVTRALTRLTRPFLFARELLQHTKPPLHLIVPLFGIQAVWTASSDELMWISPLRHITLLAIIAAFTWLGLRVVTAVQQVILHHNPTNIADNLHARRIQTQTKVLIQTLGFFVLLFGAAAMLMTFPAARQFGTSLLASAGVAGLAVGFAAKPVLGNLIAGLQIAFTQPFRLDDVVIVENEWGRIEEITGTYVVIRIWDDRRLIVPLQWFIEKPFQNWTRTTSAITGSIFFWVDYSVPIEPLRQELERLCKEVPELWDGRVTVLQVTEATEGAIQIRILVSSVGSSQNWDLRCYIREKMLNFVASNYPESLPKMRATLHEVAGDKAEKAQQSEPERQPPV